MINILRNSVKFTTQGVIRLTAECFIANKEIQLQRDHNSRPENLLKEDN
jgi:hypothetical protein